MEVILFSLFIYDVRDSKSKTYNLLQSKVYFEVNVKYIQALICTEPQ